MSVKCDFNLRDRAYHRMCYFMKSRCHNLGPVRATFGFGLACIFGLSGLGLLTLPARAQPDVVEHKINSAIGNYRHFFGKSVKVDDGRLLISSSDLGRGSVHIFQQNEWGLWVQKRLDSSKEDYFAYSVDLKGSRAIASGGDSNVIHVLDQDIGTGAWAKTIIPPPDGLFFSAYRPHTISGNRVTATVYGMPEPDAIKRGWQYFPVVCEEQANGQWTSTRLVSANPAHWQAGSTTISGDKIIYAISSLRYPNGKVAGCALLFERDESGNWIETVLSDLDAPPPGTFYRSALAFDGKTCVIGSPSSGTAVLYREDESGEWIESTLSGTDSEEQDFFGSAVAVDGSRILVSALYKNQGTGCIYIFDESELGVWRESTLKASDHMPDMNLGFGLHLQGNLIISGARTDSPSGIPYAGSAYLFDLSGSQPETPEPQVITSAPDGFEPEILEGKYDFLLESTLDQDATIFQGLLSLRVSQSGRFSALLRTSEGKARARGLVATDGSMTFQLLPKWQTEPISIQISTQFDDLSLSLLASQEGDSGKTTWTSHAAKRGDREDTGARSKTSGRYNAVLSPVTAYAYGTGFLSSSVNSRARWRFAGQSPNGVRIRAASSLDINGQSKVFIPSVRDSGVLAGEYSLNSQLEVNGTFEWHLNPYHRTYGRWEWNDWLDRRLLPFLRELSYPLGIHQEVRMKGYRYSRASMHEAFPQSRKTGAATLRMESDDLAEAIDTPLNCNASGNLNSGKIRGRIARLTGVTRIDGSTDPESKIEGKGIFLNSAEGIQGVFRSDEDGGVAGRFSITPLP